MEELGPVDVADQFGRTKAKWIRATAGGFLLFVAVLIAAIATNSLWLALAAFGFVLLLGVYTNFIMLRCPSCGAWPGRSYWGFPRHCQNCGAALA